MGKTGHFLGVLLKYYIYAFRILVAKICVSKYSYSPLPFTMHKKGFFEKLIKRKQKNKSSEKRK